MSTSIGPRQPTQQQSRWLNWRFWRSAVSAAPVLIHRIAYTTHSVLRRFLTLHPNPKLVAPRQKVSSDERGFTLPELISVMVVSALFAGLIMYFGFSYWRYGSLMEADLGTFVSRLDAQDVVRELIGTSSGLISQNSITDTHTLNPDPSAGNNYWLAIHAVPGNIPIGTANTISSLLYFRRISINTSNAIIMNGSQPYEDEYVLYLNGSNKQLYLRTLANPNAANNRLKTSCPPAQASVSCPADRVILTDVSSIDITYYSRSGNTINYHSSTDPSTGQYNGPDFSAVEALQYTFHVVKKSLFITSNGTFNDTIVRIALRNT